MSIDDKSPMHSSTVNQKTKFFEHSFALKSTRHGLQRVRMHIESSPQLDPQNLWSSTTEVAGSSLVVPAIDF